jgi:hypothetical protein
VKLTNKPAILGKAMKVSNMHTRDSEGDKGGDAGELAPGRELLLTKIMVPKKFFNELLDNNAAWDVFFDVSSKPPEPSLPRVGSLKITESFKGCSGTITFGVSAKQIEFASARIKNISVKPVTGGVGEMRCTLQAVLPRKVTLLDLEDHIGKEITISLKFGDIDEGDEEEEKQSDFVAEQQREAAAADEGESEGARH